MRAANVTITELDEDSYILRVDGFHHNGEGMVLSRMGLVAAVGRGAVNTKFPQPPEPPLEGGHLAGGDDA